MSEKDNSITFVARVSKSGKKRLINIPVELFDEINESVKYYKVKLIPIELNDF